MISQLYFDPSELKRGSFFTLLENVRTVEGHSYELEEWIGRGGNASVYRCRDRATGDEFAIKFLLNLSSARVKRFLRETRLLKELRGDHITTYHGTGRVKVRKNKALKDNLLPFVVMELADRNLQEVMRSASGPLDYERYAGQFRGLASALAALHEHAVHRDIKPENILVSGDRWLLSDYGLCTFVNPDGDDLTPDGQNVGPKFWLSPEAHNRRLGCGDKIDTASDVFQMASIFWYVANGRQPSGIVTQDDWKGPGKLFSVLYSSLLHDKSKRPKNGAEFFTALEEALTQ